MNYKYCDVCCFFCDAPIYLRILFLFSHKTVSSLEK